jgi:hypothetical protein
MLKHHHIKKEGIRSTLLAEHEANETTIIMNIKQQTRKRRRQNIESEIEKELLPKNYNFVLNL